MSERSNTGGSGTADWLLNAVKQNPEGLLFLAAGCALLLRKGHSATQDRSETHHYARAFHGEARESDGTDALRQSRSGEWAQGAAQAMEAGREYASDVARSVSDTAADYAAAVSGYADDTGQKVREQSRRVAEQAQTTMQSILREQPLAVALAGLAAGAAVATAFPATKWERRNLGTAGRRLTETAAETARQKFSEATTAAGQQLMSAAQERGLTAEGLKQVARDVAGAITGERKDPQSSGTGRPEQSGMTGHSGSANRSGEQTAGRPSGLASRSTSEPRH
jgi:hypothetical protein